MGHGYVAGAADYLKSAYLLNISGKKTSGFRSDSIYNSMLSPSFQVKFNFNVNSTDFISAASNFQQKSSHGDGNGHDRSV